MDDFKTEQLRVREREKEGGKWVKERVGKTKGGWKGERERVQANEQAILAFLFWAAFTLRHMSPFSWSLHPLLTLLPSCHPDILHRHPWIIYILPVNPSFLEDKPARPHLTIRNPCMETCGRSHTRTSGRIDSQVCIISRRDFTMGNCIKSPLKNFSKKVRCSFW